MSPNSLVSRMFSKCSRYLESYDYSSKIPNEALASVLAICYGRLQAGWNSSYLP